jgi:hypothetical protein
MTYINIDDGWQAGREAFGRSRPNSRCGDIKADFGRTVSALIWVEN